MSEITLSNNERLEEIGRILASGALRMLSKKKEYASKTRLAAGAKTGLIVREGL